MVQYFLFRSSRFRGKALFIFAFVFLFAPFLASGGSETNRYLPIETYRDKLKGGLLGQMAGVAYGFPYEFRFQGWTVPGWMVHDWKPEMLELALPQDDLYVEMTFLEALAEQGPAASAEQVAARFAESRYPLWHANKSARTNLREGIKPPLSGHPRYNPHADDIDFQIEADLFGLICPGMPAAAQELTWRIGHIINYGDGVYGGVFVAAMYSAAFFEDEPLKVVEAGLAAIPEDSNYHKTISDVVRAYRENPGDWKRAWRVMNKKWRPRGHCPSRHPLYFWENLGIAANINGACAVIALLYGQGDPWKTLEIAVRCGLDADCNASTALGVLGTMMGFSRMPESLKKELGAMKGRNFSYTSYDWVLALEDMEKLALEIVKARGGKAVYEKNRVVGMEIPPAAPGVLPLEQWPYGTPGEQVRLPSGQ